MSRPATADEFRATYEPLRTREGYADPAAWALGIATWSGGKVLDTWYPAPQLADNLLMAAVCADVAGLDRPGTAELDDTQVGELLARCAPFLGGDLTGHPNLNVLNQLVGVGGQDERRAVRRGAVVTQLGALDGPPLDTHDVYLRLHLLSHRLVRPHGVNLDGQFGLLNNVVWTSAGPCDPVGFELTRLRFRAAGEALGVHSVDKFPRMVDYVIPSGVRIADADRVRLGAHLAEGTTVMHEGFVNFNAGTLGTAMVEGRISAGVVVGADSDIGGGASIIGTLSGGGKEVVSIGERCLLGANGGIGISLGDDCIVAAGTYITAGTKVTLPDGTVVKAIDLSGRSGVLYLQDSVTGTVRARPRGNAWTEGLNADLHAN